MKRIATLAALAALTVLHGTGTAQAPNPITPSKPLDPPRAFHGSAVLGDYVYVIGGTTERGGQENPDPSVLRARITPAGEIGAWEPTTPLPESRHYAATLVLNDVVYVIGGSNGGMTSHRFNTAVFSRPLPNGSLLPWAESQPFPGQGLSNITAVSTPGHIHVIGGLDGDGSPTAKVWTNSIHADGSMGAWAAGPPLPAPSWYHAAGVAGGRVYVWGGLPTYQPENVYATVVSAPVLGSGKLGEWRREQNQLPTGFYSAASAVAGPYLISFCPRYAGGANSSDVWFARVTPQGLSPWSKRPAQIENRIYQAAAPDFRRGMIFINGGRPARGEKMLATNYVFRLSPDASRMATDSWIASETAHANTVLAVTQTMGASVPSYTVASTLSGDAAKGFLPYELARSTASSSGKPLILYFCVPDAKPCVEQKQLLATPEFQSTLPQGVFAWIDSAQSPQLTQQLGVYRVPTWIIYGKSGAETHRRAGVITPAELKEKLGAAQ